VSNNQERKYFQGIKSVNINVNFTPLSKCEKSNLVIYFPGESNANADIGDIPVFFVFADLIQEFSANNVFGVYFISPNINVIADTIRKNFPDVNTIGIVLHNKGLIKQIVKQRIYQPLIKIFEVKNQSEILYKFRKATKKTDLVLLLQDDYVLNYFTYGKILKMLASNNHPFAGMNDNLLKYGASAVFTPDYYKEGEKAGKVICEFLHKQHHAIRTVKLFTTNYKVKINE
jgi:ABC-type uncharacterized transport system substrate-binding protein